MGTFGRKICQNDSVLDFYGELQDGSDINVLFEKYGVDYAFKGLLQEDISNWDGYHLNVAIFLVALAVESVNPGSVNLDYYENKDSEYLSVLNVVSINPLSKSNVNVAKQALLGLVNYVKSNKEDFVKDTMSDETLYDAVGIKNTVSFTNCYRFYMAVLKELFFAFKSVKKSSKNKEVKPSKGYIIQVFENGLLEEETSNLFCINNINQRMIETGFTDVLHLETGEFSRCYYLAKKVSSFSDCIMSLLKSSFKDHQNYVVSKATEDGEIDIDCLYDCNQEFSDGMEFIIEENIYDNSMINVLSERVSKEYFWSSEYEKANPKIMELVSVVDKEWSQRGIPLDKIDRITLRFDLDIATDIEKTKNFSLFEGVSRRFKSVWNVPENPTPLTEDTYEIIYELTAFKEDIIKRKDLVEEDI